MKKDILIKIAITFGDTRNILNKMKEKGIKMKRGKGLENSGYNPIKNNIIIGKGGATTLKPRNVLAHEYGHAVHFNKKTNNAGIFGRIKDRVKAGVSYGKDLYHNQNYGETKFVSKTIKQERIANNNALGVLKDKSSREDYKKGMKYPYSTYKSNSSDKNILNKKPWER